MDAATTPVEDDGVVATPRIAGSCRSRIPFDRLNLLVAGCSYSGEDGLKTHAPKKGRTSEIGRRTAGGRGLYRGEAPGDSTLYGGGSVVLVRRWRPGARDGSATSESGNPTTRVAAESKDSVVQARKCMVISYLTL